MVRNAGFCMMAACLIFLAGAGKSTERRHMMHVQVIGANGHRAGGATIRVTWQGGGHHHSAVHRANAAGRAEFAMAGGSFVVRAHKAGGGSGSTSGAMAGSNGSVMVRLHGGQHPGYWALGGSTYYHRSGRRLGAHVRHALAHAHRTGTSAAARHN